MLRCFSRCEPAVALFGLLLTTQHWSAEPLRQRPGYGPKPKPSPLSATWILQSPAQRVAKEGDFSRVDTRNLLQKVQQIAGTDGRPFITTVTDAGMVDLARNMLSSLADVGCPARRLVVGMGRNLCRNFWGFLNTTCVEVYQDSQIKEEEAPWGSLEYWSVVLRKHVILSIIASSGFPNPIVFTDPDVVFLDSPLQIMSLYPSNTEIVFSPNNYLERDAKSCEDVGAEYERRGLPGLSVGPRQRHPDINTGLFFMRPTHGVMELMLQALLIFKAEPHKNRHYQQWSIVQALQQLPQLRLEVAPCDRLVNGNVFWGHRSMLRSSDVISVHANWMASELKRPCLHAAQLWIQPGAAAASLRSILGEGTNRATLDAKGASITACTSNGGEAELVAAPAWDMGNEEVWVA